MVRYVMEFGLCSKICLKKDITDLSKEIYSCFFVSTLPEYSSI